MCNGPAALNIGRCPL